MDEKITQKLEIEVSESDVKAAFLSNIIQQEVSTLIAKLLTEAWKSYATQDAIKQTVARYFSDAVKELIEAKYKTLIEAKTREFLTEEVVNQLAENAASNFMYKLKER